MPCIPNHSPLPCAINAENGFLFWMDSLAIPNILTTRNANKIIIIETPNKPNSSPMTASIKSVCASGKYCNFSTLAPSPEPKNSPLPNAINECVNW